LNSEQAKPSDVWAAFLLHKANPLPDTPIVDD